MSKNQRIKVWGMEAVRAQANGKWNTGDPGGLICGPAPGGGTYLPSSMRSMARVLMMKTHRPAMNMW